jgi:hypothetical protein
MSEGETHSPRLALVLVAGSAGTTLGQVAAEFMVRHPHAEVIGLDVESLVYDPSRRDRITYRGPGEILPILKPEHERPFLATSRLAGMLHRAPAALRPVTARILVALEQLREVSPEYVEATRAILRRHRPQAILTCNDVNIGQRSVLTAARLEGIPSILIQEGSFCTIRREDDIRGQSARGKLLRLLRRLGLVAPMTPLGTYAHARLLAVSDDYLAKFRDAGVKAATIKPIGVVRFDDIAGTGTPDAHAPSQPGRTSKILYLVQPFIRQGRVKSQTNALLAAMIEGVNIAYAHQPFDFVIRDHPRSDTATIEQLKAGLRIPYRISGSEEGFQEAMICTDIVLGHYSTGLLEALIMDRQAICIPIPPELFTDAGESLKQQWFGQVGFPLAHDSESTAALIVQALPQHGRNVPIAAIASEVGPVDGRATERAIDEIDKLLASG